jgi:protein CpxP
MKQKLLATTLAICIIATGSLSVNANPRYTDGDNQQSVSESEYGGHHMRGNHRQNRDEMRTEVLNLSEDQQEQIKAIREEERTFSDGIREKMQEYREQMQELTNAGNFDEEAVRAIAQEKANNQVEMSVSKARMRNQIHAILTTEQQELADKLQTMRQGKKEKHNRGSRW